LVTGVQTCALPISRRRVDVAVVLLVVDVVVLVAPRRSDERFREPHRTEPRRLRADRVGDEVPRLTEQAERTHATLVTGWRTIMSPRDRPRQNPRRAPAATARSVPCRPSPRGVRRSAASRGRR